MIRSLLTPNQQLAVIFGLFIAFSFLVGLMFSLVRRQLVMIEGKLGGPVTPLWRHTLAELSAILRHPHAWAKEMDALLDEANREPEIPMKPERFERLIVLLNERTKSTSPDLREWEREAAEIFLRVIPFARREAKSMIGLSGIQLVGTQAPMGQSLDDKHARANA